MLIRKFLLLATVSLSSSFKYARCMLTTMEVSATGESVSGRGSGSSIPIDPEYPGTAVQRMMVSPFVLLVGISYNFTSYSSSIPVRLLDNG